MRSITIQIPEHASYTIEKESGETQAGEHFTKTLIIRVDNNRAEPINLRVNEPGSHYISCE